MYVLKPWVIKRAASAVVHSDEELRLFSCSLSHPTAISRQNPILGQYRIRSATTKPTGKNKLLAGMNGRTVNARLCKYTSHKFITNKSCLLKVQQILSFFKIYQKSSILCYAKHIKAYSISKHNLPYHYESPGTFSFIRESIEHKFCQYSIQSKCTKIARISKTIDKRNSAHRPVTAQMRRL